jgi:hypothetical protein
MPDRPRLGGRLRGDPDSPHEFRRWTEQTVDQVWARGYQRLGPRKQIPSFDGEPTLAFITVNFSTTRFLKLMLCTLGEQSALGMVQHLIIVDNHSRDGGTTFLRSLASRVPRIHLLERRYFLNHAAGMRAGLRSLQGLERDDRPDERARIVIFCDTDVVFRNPATLLDLSATMIHHDAALGGEVRTAPGSGHPDIQASFFAVRRDVFTRRDVRPLEHHGSPAFSMQASMVKAGLPIVDFPSNHGGYVLHRGRASVAAATTYGIGAYDGVAYRNPHFMGVPDGARIWAGIEETWSPLLDESSDPALLDHLTRRFGVLGSV